MESSHPFILTALCSPKKPCLYCLFFSAYNNPLFLVKKNTSTALDVVTIAIVAVSMVASSRKVAFMSRKERRLISIRDSDQCAPWSRHISFLPGHSQLLWICDPVSQPLLSMLTSIFPPRTTIHRALWHPIADGYNSHPVLGESPHNDKNKYRPPLIPGRTIFTFSFCLLSLHFSFLSCSLS